MRLVSFSQRTLLACLKASTQHLWPREVGSFRSDSCLVAYFISPHTRSSGSVVLPPRMPQPRPFQVAPHSTRHSLAAVESPSSRARLMLTTRPTCRHYTRPGTHCARNTQA